MVCWITPTTWESLILYLNSHLHGPIYVTAGWKRVPRYKPWQRRSLKSSNKSATLLSPKISASLLTAHRLIMVDPKTHAVANIRLKRNEAIFFQNTFCNHSTDSITNSIIFWFANVRCQYCSHFLHFQKTAGTKNEGGCWSFLVNLKGF